MKWEHKLSKRIRVLDHEALMLEKCWGRNVLHLGCVDTNLMYEKIRRGT